MLGWSPATALTTEYRLLSANIEVDYFHADRAHFQVNQSLKKFQVSSKLLNRRWIWEHSFTKVREKAWPKLLGKSEIQTNKTYLQSRTVLSDETVSSWTYTMMDKRFAIVNWWQHLQSEKIRLETQDHKHVTILMIIKTYLQIGKQHAMVFMNTEKHLNIGTFKHIGWLIQIRHQLDRLGSEKP